MGILAIINLLAPILLNLLGTSGVINPSLSALITKLTSGITTLVAALIGGGGATADVEAVLQAIQVEVNTLKTSTQLFTLNEANEINALDTALSNALAAYTASTKVDDPSDLTPLPESFPAPATPESASAAE